MMLEGMRNAAASRERRRSPSPKNIEHAKRVAQAHLNGTSEYNATCSVPRLVERILKNNFDSTVAGMVTLQNLQNLANLQNLPQVASFAAGLQSMSSELTNSQLINAPLNLTVTPPCKLSQCFLIFSVVVEIIKLLSKKKKKNCSWNGGVDTVVVHHGANGHPDPAAVAAPTGGDAAVHHDLRSAGPGDPGSPAPHTHVAR